LLDSSELIHPHLASSSLVKSGEARSTHQNLATLPQLCGQSLVIAVADDRPKKRKKNEKKKKSI